MSGADAGGITDKEEELPSVTVVSTSSRCVGSVLGLPSTVGSASSTVPSQKLANLVLRPGDMSPASLSGIMGPGNPWAGCTPGIVAVIPRIGSVSSCSGDGSARGATDILAPAHLIVAAVAKASGFSG